MKKVTRLLLAWFDKILDEVGTHNAITTQAHHDLNTIMLAVLEFNIHGTSNILEEFLPMIQCTEFNELKDAIRGLKEADSVCGEGRELDFFTGKEVPTNPLNKMPNILPVPTATPGGSENLSNWLSSLNGSESLVGLTAAQMTLNLCRKIVDQAMGKASKRDAHWINS
jgi:hypothetical protein